MNIIDEVQKEWAPPDHPIFQLVPDVFQERIDTYLRDLGNPILNADTFWVVYVSVLARFVSPDDRRVLDPSIQDAVSQYAMSEPDVVADPMEIIGGLRPLRQGDRLVGNPLLQPSPNVGAHPVYNDVGDMVGFADVAEFTDEEDELDGDEHGML